MTNKKSIRLLALCSIALAACSEPPVSPQSDIEISPSVSTSQSSSSRYLVVFRSPNSVARGFEAEVARIGGVVESTMPRIGAAVVSGISGSQASQLARLSGVQSVDQDEWVPMRTRRTTLASANGEILDAAIASPSMPQTAGLYAYQWNMRAINAPAAWAAGFRGSSAVKVGIIDTGIDEGSPTGSGGRSNIDLFGRIDRSLSRSFMPVEDTVVQRLFPGAPLWTDLDGHGTNVASQVASNAWNLAAVTSQATLVSLKACTILPFPGTENDTTVAPGYCSTAAVFEALYYAAEQGLDVVNMSLGGGFPRQACAGCPSLVNRVLNYAKSGGTTVVVAAGNSASNLDFSGSWYNMYCDAPAVICVSATGPTSSGPAFLGPFVNPDAPAIYSDYGRSAINVAAPGGNYSLGIIGEGEDAQTVIVGVSYVWSLCPRLTAAYYDRTAGFVKEYGACGLWGFLGTSQASPHAAGLAALLVQQHGRNPGTIRDVMQSTADKLGKSGNDPRLGKGRINVARAVGAI
ncbi:MAG: S8 family serine peptidase [Gemmatimonadaceae bacterium]